MAEYEIPYGRTHVTLRLPPGCEAELIAPLDVLAAPDPQQVVRAALEAPVGGQPLSAYKGARRAAVAINDKTRPVPHGDLLPPLLAQIEALGIAPEDITLFIATGTHVPMRPEEFALVVPPDILGRYPVVSHDARKTEELVPLGETARGNAIWVNRRYAEADLRIVVGNIEPHQFEGFSGGYKTAAIGLAGFDTINRNHGMMMDPHSDLGHFYDNPARQEVEEMGRRLGVHLALNAILNEGKKIVEVLAGDPTAVMEKGIPRVLELYESRVPARFDLMVVSPGGHPKDINLYQAQKSLGHAMRVMKMGGTVLLLAACPEGTGSASYEAWMEGMKSFSAVFERFGREGFRIGPHKAYQIARDASRVQVLMLTEMTPAFVRKLLLTPIVDLDAAAAEAVAALPAGGRIGIMPYANSTIPVVRE